jgi:hypothetical protein
LFITLKGDLIVRLPLDVVASPSISPHSSSFGATNLKVANLLAIAYDLRWDQINSNKGT